MGSPVFLLDRFSSALIMSLASLTFDEYMKSLQKEGYLKYGDGKWKVSDKALDYIEKYHGG
jgi:uncharacterized protein with von Willebrand factor type A (vWA) domain